DVVDDGDGQRLEDADERPGDRDVLFGRFGETSRVVVGEEHSGRVMTKRRFYDEPRVDRRAGETALVQRQRVQNVVLVGEQDEQEDFVVGRRELVYGEAREILAR